METFEMDEQDNFWLSLADAVSSWATKEWFSPVDTMVVEEIASELKSEWISTLDDAIDHFQHKYS